MKQYWALLYMNLASIRQRLGLVLTIVIGVACAVGVLVSMLAMGIGAHREATGNVRPDRASVITLGSPSPMQSSLTKDTAKLVSDLAGIKHNAAGKPIAISQVIVYVQARDRISGEKIGFAMLGVTPGQADYSPELHLTAGRMYRPGLREVIASLLKILRRW